MTVTKRKEDEEKKSLTPEASPGSKASGVNVPKVYSSVDLSKYNSGYQKSDSVLKAEQNKIDAENALKGYGDFQYAKQGDLSGIMDKILNRQEFKYDLNGDALYKQYADKYITQGKMAMQDTMGRAAALTGGYGNSYAASVGNQAYQQSLQQLNDVVPELYQMAYDRYAQEGQDLLNQYSLLSADKNAEYGMWGDKRNQLIAERDYAANAANDAYARDYGEFNDAYNRDFSRYWQETQFGYGQDRDAAADAQWRESFDYGKQRDEVADKQWQDSFDYGKQRDEIADAQWQQNFDYAKDRDAVADSQWRESFDYAKDRDKVSDAQWRESFDYGKERDEASDAENAKSFAYGQAMNAIQAGVMPSEDVLKSAGIDEKTANSMIEAYKNSGSSGSGDSTGSKLTVDGWNKINEKAASIAGPDRLNKPADGGEMELLTYLDGLLSANIIGDEDLLSIMELYFPSAKVGEGLASSTVTNNSTKQKLDKKLTLK
jgi:hypothetical protein